MPRFASVQPEETNCRRAFLSNHAHREPPALGLISAPFVDRGYFERIDSAEPLLQALRLREGVLEYAPDYEDYEKHKGHQIRRPFSVGNLCGPLFGRCFPWSFRSPGRNRAKI